MYSTMQSMNPTNAHVVEAPAVGQGHGSGVDYTYRDAKAANPPQEPQSTWANLSFARLLALPCLVLILKVSAFMRSSILCPDGFVSPRDLGSSENKGSQPKRI